MRFGRRRRAALVVAGLLAGVVSVAGARPASAHGGGITDSLLAGSMCAQKLDGAEVDLNIFSGAGGQPTCDDLSLGAATLTFDLVDPWLRQVPVGVEVVQSDAGARSLASVPARVYPGGVISVNVRLDKPGRYTAAVLSGGSRASFPIGVGGLAGMGSAQRLLGTPIGWIAEAFVAMLAGVIGWLGVRRLRSSRGTARARRQGTAILDDRTGAIAQPYQLPTKIMKN
ncbi:MAG: hypothetical protein JWM18_5071 [Chloroflexi bacterium]|jgi:hypothetical protein|nr:hypothetical protein [Chloroflexota bacterium]